MSIEGAGNLIIRNTAANNTLNYFFANALTTPQAAGPIVKGTNDVNYVIPWANLEY